MDNRARADKIAGKLVLERCTGDGDLSRIVDFITAQLDEAVREAHLEIATKQALIQGEAVMMGGNYLEGGKAK